MICLQNKEMQKEKDEHLFPFSLLSFLGRISPIKPIWLLVCLVTSFNQVTSNASYSLLSWLVPGKSPSF